MRADKPSREDIPIGRENAISRAELARKWNCSDRDARNILSELRVMPTNDLYAILSCSSHAGYWRSDDMAEIKRFLNEAKARSRNVLAACADADRIFRQGGSKHAE